MKHDVLDIVVVGTICVGLLALLFAGCRALYRNPQLWL